jgi:hypothetical protein
MDTVLPILAKGLIAGTFVVIFSVVSHAVAPKSFAGIFGAAPSIALASLTITVLDRGASAGKMQAFSMIFAGLAMVAYCATAVITVDRFGALRGSIVAFVSWFVVAAAAYFVVVEIAR